MVPLRQLTIPCLELQAPVIAFHLAKTIVRECSIQFGDDKFFSDSSNTLAWIQSDSHSFKPFVSAGVGDIQNNWDPSQWKHIPGEENVADDVSRGLLVKQLDKRPRISETARGTMAGPNSYTATEDMKHRHVN